jgi:hypothetical protein
MGKQVAGQSQYRILSGGKRQGYRASIDPIALGLSCQTCIDLHSLVDLASCSGGFMREQMRGFTQNLHGVSSQKTAFFNKLVIQTKAHLTEADHIKSNQTRSNHVRFEFLTAMSIKIMPHSLVDK